MKCSRCQHDDTKVIESRDVADGDAIRRRRECTNCQYRFTTYERLEHPQIIVVKNNGTRELFNRDKLLAGLYRACEKTAVTSLQLERVVSDIERHVYDCGEQEITSAAIGDLVMSSLAKLNEVAYVRFASVYRRFKDIAGFERELIQIRERKLESVDKKIKVV
ncbi:MAG TPA: transcriptional regulator NrdR [Candidatus Saccharimonadales bacterium]|nr:transcriptional regulator NrdR [Candidatus Saccharimonadales bacterium]